MAVAGWLWKAASKILGLKGKDILRTILIWAGIDEVSEIIEALVRGGHPVAQDPATIQEYYKKLEEAREMIRRAAAEARQPVHPPLPPDWELAPPGAPTAPTAVAREPRYIAPSCVQVCESAPHPRELLHQEWDNYLDEPDELMEAEQEAWDRLLGD